MLQAYGYSHGVACWINHTEQGKHFHSNNDHYLVTDSLCASLMRSLMEEARTERKDSRIICAQMLSTLFLLLRREIVEGNFVHPGPKPIEASDRLSGSGFIGQLQAYLETNCHKPLTQDSVAEYFYMSRSQFARRIRQGTGSTFNDILISIRIERAQALLRETDWTFNTISSHLSFKSSSYFLQLFRERVGCTPGEYRETSVSLSEIK